MFFFSLSPKATLRAKSKASVIFLAHPPADVGSGVDRTLVFFSLSFSLIRFSNKTWAMIWEFLIQVLAFLLPLRESLLPTRIRRQFRSLCVGFIPMVVCPIGFSRFRYETLQFLLQIFCEFDFPKSITRFQTRVWKPGDNGSAFNTYRIKNQLWPDLTPFLFDEDEPRRWPLHSLDWVLASFGSLTVPTAVIFDLKERVKFNSKFYSPFQNRFILRCLHIDYKRWLVLDRYLFLVEFLSTNFEAEACMLHLDLLEEAHGVWYYILSMEVKEEKGTSQVKRLKVNDFRRRERITQAQFFKETLVRKCWCQYIYISELVLDTSALMLRFVNRSHNHKLLSTIRNREKSNMKLDNNRSPDRLASKATLRKASSNSLLLYFLLVYGTYICVCNNCVSLILYVFVITLLD